MKVTEPHYYLPLVVVEGSGPILMGRYWLHTIKLNWAKIHYTQAPSLHEMLENYSEVFEKGLGMFK